MPDVAFKVFIYGVLGSLLLSVRVRNPRLYSTHLRLLDEVFFRPSAAVNSMSDWTSTNNSISQDRERQFLTTFQESGGFQKIHS